MEEKKICKICNKSFSNGKALGGHIRSHLAKQSIPPKASQSQSLPTRRRSSRQRRTALSEEKAALFLIQLSRDTWKKSQAKQEQVSTVLFAQPNKSFRCEACDKDFESYQALGGHKASHSRRVIEDEEEQRGYNNDKKKKKKKKKKKRRLFECEFCYKLFGSGQALGGHKKAHFSATLPKNVSSGTLIIDLNFPPLSDGDDDDDDDDYDYGNDPMLQFPL